jgi:eukaryotic-like serine/threonine-protein kinase
MEAANRGPIDRIGRYEVAGVLASGGMAEILLGRVKGPSGFDRPVVLKRILPHLARQSAFVDMFLDEARIIARIHHPNVVDVHELGKIDGELFMVMEYLEGESVSSLERRLIRQNQPLEPRLAAFIVAEACAGVHAAHELRDDHGVLLEVVHRDVSPQNVFLTYAGGVKLLDFGIAKTSDRIARTEVGQLKGKLDFMAPEQCKSERLDRRTDVFALGIVLYELLTQRRLFKRPSAAGTVQAILNEPIVPPSRLAPDCPESLTRICLRALERDPDKRFPTAHAMGRELSLAMAKLPGEHLPEEQLAALMSALFEDRRLLKGEMLRRIREGSNPKELPSAEADETAELEASVVGTAMDSTKAQLAPRRRRARWPLALVLASGGAVAAALFWGREPASRDERAQAASPAATGAEAVPAPASPPATVHVVLETDPSGAEVVVDGRSMGLTPSTLTLDRTTARRALVLRREGFQDDAEELTPDVDQKLRFVLRPVAKPSARSKGPPTRRPNDDQPAKW